MPQELPPAGCEHLILGDSDDAKDQRQKIAACGSSYGGRCGLESKDRSLR